MSEDDDALVALVRAIGSDGWADLDDIIERLATEPHPYEWRGGERSPNGAIQMRWVDYGDAVSRTLAWLDEHHLVTPLADWTNWFSPERYPNAASVHGAAVADAVRLATSIVRGDRFAEGAIASTVDSGVLVAILRRFKRWRAETSPGQ